MSGKKNNFYVAWMNNQRLQMRRARRMLSVALPICIIWNLDHGDINFRKTNKQEICYCSATLQCSAVAFYIPLQRPLGAIHSCSYSGKERKRGEKRKERREGRRWEKLGFHPWITDQCRFRSSSKIIRVRSFFSLLFLWEIDARVWQFLWIS